jgi:hypothetical protein
VADSHTVSEKVRQADLDFGLILDPEGQAGLSVLAFVELEMGVVMRPDNPWRMRLRSRWGAQPAAPYRPWRSADCARPCRHALSPL